MFIGKNRNRLKWISVVGTICMLSLLVVTSPAFAQGTGGAIGGGSAFGASNQTFGKSLVAMLRYARWLLFFAGWGYAIWGAFMSGTDKPFFSKFRGAFLCWAFAAVGQVLFTFSQGDEVEIVPDLGN